MDDTRHGGRKVKCQCDCGNIGYVFVTNLTRGLSTSCGCEKLQAFVGTKIYTVWSSMKSRCNNPKHHAFMHYGGRGITVCDDWNDVYSFCQWAFANGYEEGLSLDRIDNNGNYEPSNCRWATHKEQHRNQRNNRLLEYNGESKPVSVWAEELGINNRTILSRLRKGWSVQNTLETKVREKAHV
jgi:hypothetical protein